MNTNKNVSPKTAEAVENQEAAVSQPDVSHSASLPHN